jgi:hypothetical protein
MKKIVINTCHGGFGLSHEAIMRYAALKGIELEVKEPEPRLRCLVDYEYYVNGEHFWDRDIPRDDLALVATVQALGDKANDRHADLKIVEIPDDVEWYIHDYDGAESVHEQHRSWS